MSNYPVSNAPDLKIAEDAGRYFRYMAEFVGFDQTDADAIRQSSFIIEKYLPGIIGRFYTNLLQYPPTRKFFLKSDGTVDQAYLELRMYHQANFWRRVGSGVYDDEFANFVDYVGRAHTSRGADPRIYIAERYVIGMVGFVQHAIIEAMMIELEGFEDGLQARAVKGWNKLCMVLLELLARAYGNERGSETYEQLHPVDAQAVHDLAIDSYEKSLGIRRLIDHREIVVGRVEEIPDGERKLIETDGISIGVFHHKGGWYALNNRCLHHGGPVATGRLEGDNLICPWHGYTYNVTNGQLLIDPGARLDTYKVELRGDQVVLIVPLHEQDVQPAAEPSPASVPVNLANNEFFIADLQPGQMKLLSLDGQRVLAYNIDGEYYATSEECTHVGGPLSEGELKGNEVVCPWHYSCFRVTDGAVTCPPAREPLKTYRVVIDDDIARVQS
jgi:nitrite reductase/ring-hydroxylating ferredoxin subunit